MKWHWIALALVGGAALAAGRFAMTVTVNGKAGKVAPIERDGEVFIPVSTLKEAGAEVAVAGEKMTVRFIPVPGATQIDAVEGGLDEWMTNGVWRVKATNPRTESGIFKLDFEVRNATPVAASLAVNTGARVPELFAGTGLLTTLPRSDRAWAELSSPNLPPASSRTVTLEWSVAKGEQPEKLLLRFELTDTQRTVMKKIGIAFAGPAVNFRIFLK